MRLLPPTPVCDDAEFDDAVEFPVNRRYWLSRKVAQMTEGPVGLFVALNPSIAGATGDDATVRKWRGFAARWGWSGFWVANLFSHIDTNSAKLKKLSYAEAVGPFNDEVLAAMVRVVPDIVCCWGNNVPKHLMNRVPHVLDLIENSRRAETRIWHFGLSQRAHPIHPLMLSYDTKLKPFGISAALTQSMPKARVSRRDSE